MSWDRRKPAIKTPGHLRGAGAPVKFWKSEPCQGPALAETDFSGYIDRVNGLTKQEQTVLILVLGLLLVGWAVKYWRTAHPSASIVQPAAP